MGAANCLITNIFKISSFVLNRRKKLIQFWKQLEGEGNYKQFSFLGELYTFKNDDTI